MGEPWICFKRFRFASGGLKAKGYEANNKSIKATLGTLSIGKPTYTDVHGNHAYSVYPVTFTDTQNGKSLSYKGSMAVTLQKMASGWIFTGIASAWGMN